MPPISGLDPFACLDQANQAPIGAYSPGMAWAARRSFLETHGFYDACIVGGGDRAMTAAGYDCFAHFVQRHCMIEPQARHYLAWAEPFREAALGGIGAIDGDLFHLWHGALEHRRTRERHPELSRFAFDPYEDIALTTDGLWRWNTDKGPMHDYVRSHFVSRREDG